MVSRAILKSAKSGDKLAIENLVNKNIKYIYWVAHKYCFRGIGFEDLVSEGKVGLFKALKNYDIKNSSEFLAYAYPYIKKEMLNYIDSNIFCVHISDLQIRKYHNINRSQTNNLKELKNFKSENVISIDNSTINFIDSCTESKINDDIFWYDLQFCGMSSTEVFIIKKFYVEGFQLKEIEKMLNMEKKMAIKIKNRALTKIKKIFLQDTEVDLCEFTAEGGD